MPLGLNTGQQHTFFGFRVTGLLLKSYDDEKRENVMTRYLPSTVAIAALVAAMVVALPANAAPMRAYIGTYTPDPPGAAPDNHGQGIYLVDVDAITGAPSHPRLVAKALSPTWMTISADRKFLYATNEIATYGAAKSGSISAYAVDGTTGALKLLNVVDSGGAIPAFISIYPGGKFALVANYIGASFAVIRIKPDGSLGEMTDVVKPQGPLNPATASDNPPGQFTGSDHQNTRGHMIAPDPSGQYVIGDDAGRDQILVWRLDTNSGKLIEVSVTKSLPGSAPRHFVFGTGSKHIYQLQEQDSRLAVYDFANGKLTARGPTISALPDGYEGSNTASELLIDKAGKHLYFANRTQDSIAVFAISADGMVSKTANVPTEADHPRSLTLDPSGRFLYSLNQHGDNVTTFRIGADGVPKFTGKYMALASPAVMVFLP
jgi:6-phosphogluconolactonase